MAWSVIVNADDYGLTRGVSRAVLRAHQDGIVTATSAMVVSPAFATTAAWLDDVPDLAVGLHLVAVGEDPPLLGAAEVPSLVDGRGAFAASSLRLAPRLAAGRVDPADLEREFEAQHAAFLDAVGRRPTHVDTHHNLHLWPSVAEVVVRLAGRWGIPWTRVPWSRRATPIGVGVRLLARRLERRVDAAPLGRPDRYFGIDEAGRMDTRTLLAVLQGGHGQPRRTDGRVVEVAVHPGERDDPELARYPWPGARRDVELDALTSVPVRDAVRRAGHRLIAPPAAVVLDLTGAVDPPADEHGPRREPGAGLRALADGD